MKDNFSDPMSDTEGYITPEQFNHLISYAKNERDRVLFTFIFYTGRRVSEVVRSLKPKHFNFKDNMVLFTILKRKGLRKWINVNSKIMNMIYEYITNNNINSNQFIFNINRFRVDQIIKDLGKRAGMEYIGKKKIHAHVLRHSFAIMMSKKLKPTISEIKKLQSLLGHANVNSTSYYLEHFNPEEMKKTVEGII